MKIKNLICVLVVCMCCFAFTGCGNDAGEVKAEAKENKEVNIKIGVMQVADSAVLYVADKENMFSAAGLNVELVEFGSASDLSKAFEAGGVDFAMTDMIVEGLLRKGGKNTKVVRTALGETSAEGRFIIAAAPGSGIEKPDDLRGKNIAISENTGMEYQVDSYMDELNIPLDEINKVSIPSLSLRYETMMEGTDVDAAILPDPLGRMAEMNGAKAVIDDTTLNNNVSITVIVADESFIENNKDAVNTFCNIYDEAAEKLNSNPDEFRQLVLDIANVPENMRETYEVQKYAVNTVPQKEEVTRLVEWLKNKGLIENEYTYDEMIDDEFIRGE